jgi:hypothetical protein
VLRKIVGSKEEEEVRGNCIMKCFLICDPNKHCVIKSRRIKRADSTYRETRTRNWWESLKERGHLEDLLADEQILWIFNN